MEVFLKDIVVWQAVMSCKNWFVHVLNNGTCFHASLVCLASMATNQDVSPRDWWLRILFPSHLWNVYTTQKSPRVMQLATGDQAPEQSRYQTSYPKGVWHQDWLQKQEQEKYHKEQYHIVWIFKIHFCTHCYFMTLCRACHWNFLGEHHFISLVSEVTFIWSSYLVI